MGLNIETLPNPMHHHARHAQVFGERSHGPLRRVRWPGFEFFSTSGVGVRRGQVQSSPDATAEFKGSTENRKIGFAEAALASGDRGWVRLFLT